MAHGVSASTPSDFGQRLSSPSAGDASHDILSALEQWVEVGTAPERLIATRFSDGDAKPSVRAQRPIYPYPQFPKYLGGDPTSAQSFGPTVHQRGAELTN
jgi:feruloyl esterase